MIKIKRIKGDALKNKIHKRIGSVVGDFRQKEILKIWDKNINTQSYYSIASLNIKCGSGTYVRGIANSLGENINIPTLAWSIKRTKIGRYNINKKQPLCLRYRGRKIDKIKNVNNASTQEAKS